MVRLRRNVQRNRLHQLNRLVWMGLVLLLSGLMVLVATTNMFTEMPLEEPGVGLVLVALLGLAFYIYRWVKFLRQRG